MSKRNYQEGDHGIPNLQSHLEPVRMIIDPENFLGQLQYHTSSSNKGVKAGCSRVFKVCMRALDIKMVSSGQTAIIPWVLGGRHLSDSNG